MRVRAAQVAALARADGFAVAQHGDAIGHAHDLIEAMRNVDNADAGGA